MAPSVAIVGMACRYPDACSPGELWENVLAQRRAFRRIPSERLRLEDYLSPDHRAPDSTYIGEAAVIEGYDFDRTRFRVSGSTFRATDLAHWLALDIAAQALADAGFHEGEGLPRDTTGVILGNTLTGEFSRANLMRLRWPYVRRVVEAALITKGWSAEQCQAFLEELESQYKAPFPPVGEETLAGSLSNTIAGRICNHFDLKGGGYTVDGACAASLLAVATACSSLVEGDFDVALAGGVDLSLDPFELVGFAKTSALAPEEMRIYDVRSAGFWPG
jgi:enediyne polyketide synthase